MPTTVLDLINRALREINVIAETEDASAEQGTQCLAKLNNMLDVWEEDGIVLGWFEQSSTSEDSPLPLSAELAVTSNLAIVCASQYGATVSTELATVADDTYTRLLNKAIRESLDNADMSHMPEGAGHYGNRYDINTDV